MGKHFGTQILGSLWRGSWALSLVMLIQPMAAQEASSASEKIFLAGASTSNITPPLGEPIVGGWQPTPAANVHDELHARCLVLDDGTSRIGIALCDNVGIPREVFEVAKRWIAEETDLEFDRLLMASTHTHSATTARSGNPMIDDRAELQGYRRFLARRIADGVRRALENLAPARIGWGSAQVEEEVFNRRWHIAEASRDLLRNPFGGHDKVRMNPPSEHPSLLRPAGPTDPEVAFLSIQTPEGDPIALLANYSLHYVGGVPSGEISADYFAIFAERIGELLGADTKRHPPFVGVMSNGTSGDINNINFQNRGGRRQPYEKMTEVAHRVADRVLEAHQDVTFHDWVPLDMRRREVSLQVRKPTAKRLAWARETQSSDEEALSHRRSKIYSERILRLAEAPDEIAVPVQAARVGGLAICAIPFEVFVEIGLELKESGPFDQTFTISLANGSYGYLPTPEQHQLGGYETWQGTSRVSAASSEILIENLQEMMRAMR